VGAITCDALAVSVLLEFEVECGLPDTILLMIEAIEVLNRNPGGTNAILHVTC